jgi:D-alanine transaminase
MLKPATVYLNGQFISRDKALISPDDRGFYFADGVYEVIKYYRNNPFCFEEHMNRLRNSLAAIQINFSGIEKLAEICQALIGANHLKHVHAAVYIQITRGVAERIHRLPEKHIKPTIYVKAFSLSPFLEQMQHGIRVITREDIRWHRCNIKSIALLPNTLLYEEAAGHGAGECLLVRNGFFTEATHSNILAVRNGAVVTHPDSPLILAGITKAVVLKICRQSGIEVYEEPIRVSEMDRYSEWLITGTGSEIIPVVQMDDIVISKGKPGPVTRLLQREFLRMTHEELAGESVVLSDE